MKFKLDENLPRAATDVVRDYGHDVLSVIDQAQPGATDEAVAEMVRSERRALVTLDLDFADIRAYPPADYAGIVVLRPRTSHVKQVLELVHGFLELVGREPLDGHLWIVESDRVRIRPS